MNDVTAIITGCSLDARFLAPCIDHARRITPKVNLVLCDHLFDGTPEPVDFIESARRTFAMSAEVTVFPHMPGQGAKYHHNMSRWIGIQKAKTTWLLVLDADEIMDSTLFNDRMLSGPGPYSSLSFACYWYFRSPRYRAKTLERAGLFVKRELMTEERCFTPAERYWMEGMPWHGHAIFNYDGKPMLHHYSWVHTKSELLRKVAGWGHSTDTDRDWTKLVETEFMRKVFDAENDEDFVHNYRFERCEPFITYEPEIMRQ